MNRWLGAYGTNPVETEENDAQSTHANERWQFE